MNVWQNKKQDKTALVPGDASCNKEAKGDRQAIDNCHALRSYCQCLNCGLLVESQDRLPDAPAKELMLNSGRWDVERDQ